MAEKTKLELTWIGKDRRPRLEPRILLEDSAYSHHSKTQHSSDIFDNSLIRGDNLLALKALEAIYAGQVKCVYIDPPYNTGSDFGHYEDGLEHSRWLSMMRERLECLKVLLSEDGCIWVSIDDNEMPYLRIIMDEVFGRRNFVAQVIWEKVYSPKSTAKFLSENHDYVLLYAKNANELRINLLPRSDEQNKAYRNPDGDRRGNWKSGDLSARNYYGEGRYPITTPSGRIIDGPPQGMYWRVSRTKLSELDADGRIWWGKDGSAIPQIKRFLSEVRDGIVPETIWTYKEVGHTQSAKQHIKQLFPAHTDLFQTAKPELLIQRILHLSTVPGDLVLDSFGGSGTTAAVAQKMGRRWIMVELGDHCETLIVPRLKKVIDGDDPGGITEAVGWKGGGGYRYYRLAPSLLEKDAFGQWVISPAYNAEMLAEAMCVHFRFTYLPSSEHYWMQGRSSETDFIYITTNSLTYEQLKVISAEVGPQRTLLICCKAFQGAKIDAFANLTVRKIPGAVLDRCEWGKDDYSLEIANLPMAEDEPEPVPPLKASMVDPAQPSLFASEAAK